MIQNGIRKKVKLMKNTKSSLIWMWRHLFHALLIFAIAILSVGASLFFLSPSLMNPDTFAYISISNYYLYDVHPSLRDAFTVGPVIPLWLALLKLMTLKISPWTESTDIIIVKAAVFLSYLLVFFSTFNLLKKVKYGFFPYVALLFLSVLIQITTDTLSLNGELVCIGFLFIAYSVLDSQETYSYGKCFFVGVIVIAAIYTKIQCIPLAALVLFSSSACKRDLRKLCISILVIWSVFEGFLFSQGIGILNRSIDMFQYIINGSMANIPDGSNNYLIKIQKYIAHFFWFLRESGYLHPVAYFVIVFGLVFSIDKKRTFFHRWEVWAAVTAITILVPGRPFTHYLIFILPFTFVFFVEILKSADNLRNNSSMMIMLAISLLIGTLKSFQAIPFALFDNKKTPSFSDFQKLDLGVEVSNLKHVLSMDPGSVLVHGWDYRFYSLLNTGLITDLDLTMVTMGFRTPVDYANKIISKKFKYIIDVINYSGLIRNSNVSAESRDKIWSLILTQNYSQIFRKNGLALYKRRDKVFENYPISKTQDSNIELLSSNFICDWCFPSQDFLKFPVPFPLFGTHGAGGDSDTGKISIKVKSNASLFNLKFVVGPKPARQSIRIRSVCPNVPEHEEEIPLDLVTTESMSNYFFVSPSCNRRSITIDLFDNGDEWGEWTGILGLESFEARRTSLIQR